MKKYWKHFKIITKHKYYVFIECWKKGLYYQGIVHDFSKYSITEFWSAARYFQGDKTPVEVMKAELGYAPSWLHHKGRNKHHWEYWTDFYEGEIKACPIPTKYIEEMACDMIGASKVYLKTKYNPLEPLNYFLKRKNKFLMTIQDKTYLESLLRENSLT